MSDGDKAELWFYIIGLAGWIRDVAHGLQHEDGWSEVVLTVVVILVTAAVAWDNYIFWRSDYRQQH